MEANNKKQVRWARLDGLEPRLGNQISRKRETWSDHPLSYIFVAGPIIFGSWAEGKRLPSTWIWCPSSFIWIYQEAKPNIQTHLFPSLLSTFDSKLWILQIVHHFRVEVQSFVEELFVEVEMLIVVLVVDVDVDVEVEVELGLEPSLEWTFKSHHQGLGGLSPPFSVQY